MQKRPETEPIHHVQWFYLSNFDLYDETSPMEMPEPQRWRKFLNHDNRALEAKHIEINNASTSQEPNQKNIIVGVSGLHVVNLPTLTLKPLYWPSSRRNDTLRVVRGLWMYQDTGLPVIDELAEILEEGYQQIKPYNVNWDKLESELEDENQERSSIFSSGRRKPSKDAISQLRWSIKPPSSGKYVLYEDGYRALLCQGGLLSYFSKGTQSQRTGLKGIPVIRDFPLKEDDGFRGLKQVTDLFLVVHGIGQKRSETQERYQFTKTCNVFRSLIQKQKIIMKQNPLLRDDYEPQLLPICWRNKINFDSFFQVTEDDENSDDVDQNRFHIEDIEIDSIPTVRRLFGDVMSDIPYYMSHHKDSIIRSVIREANRVYSLWIDCNPYFKENKGRVFIIGHSLGATVVFDILSLQPTFVKELGPEVEDDKYFKFDTNGFFCFGGPIGFFLLLNQKSIIPRKGRGSSRFPENDEYTSKNVPNSYAYAENDRYGCLAVDSFYNVYNFLDPIAMRLNPTVDVNYSRGILPSRLVYSRKPSSILRVISRPNDAPIRLVSYQQALNQLKSDETGNSSILPDAEQDVELQTRNFKHEKRAKWRMQELNENGQIDYVFTSQQGIISNKYLTMLSAHTSYWNNEDLVCFLVVETARKFGIANSVEQFRGKRASQNNVSLQ
ncbi:phospholipase [Schizosaccharomyces octosporus yFS286]|uniref:Phospholipase n=1 Tax=Schizosaccharomyces octosporus (strain yFS286) TaxID=483514 RepID=S9PS46_SCHOY|nr:phospholipase [Schizosaccharomyces octosporus yFS286]EPX71986.1 phospholipase [Schizosaccharomyces octosporus yFS286]